MITWDENPRLLSHYRVDLLLVWIVLLFIITSVNVLQITTRSFRFTTFLLKMSYTLNLIWNLYTYSIHLSYFLLVLSPYFYKVHIVWVRHTIIPPLGSQVKSLSSFIILQVSYLILIPLKTFFCSVTTLQYTSTLYSKIIDTINIIGLSFGLHSPIPWLIIMNVVIAGTKGYE